MDKWFMVTVVGGDRAGIVARLTHVLFEGGAYLGEASMARLGGNFTIMLMVRYDGSASALEMLVEPAVQSLDLRVHVDEVGGELHRHETPDVRITVFGADRAGIVAQVTGVLAEAGLQILDLQSDVAGQSDKPIYVMIIEGQAAEGIDALRSALANLGDAHIDVHIEPVDAMIG